MRPTLLLSIYPLILLFYSPTLRADDWKDALKHNLEETYILTDTGLDRLRITKPGSVLVVQKEGISGDLATDATYLPNKVKDGQVKQASGFFALMADKKTSRVYQLGERVYVFKIEVKSDEIWFYIISCDTFSVNVQGSTRQTRYKSVVEFQFPKGYLATADFSKVRDVVESVLASEKGIKSAAPKTIELGQTQEQVEAALGKPEKIIKLGSKVIYVYKDLKVVFTDGKVSDVQ